MNYSDAIDAMFGIVQASIASISIGIVPIVQTRWPGTDETDGPPQGIYWARVSEQSVLGEQTSLSTDVGLAGTKRYTNTGLLFIQIFCPKSDVKSVENGRLISTALLTALRSPVIIGGNLWFKRQQLKPMIMNTDNYQFNVSATYSFDEIV